MWMLLSDTHIRDSTLARLDETLTWVHQEFMKLRPTRVFILGDIFDNRHVLRVTELHWAKQWFDKFTQVDWLPHLHLLQGNHDTPDLNEGTVNSIGPFRSETIHVHDTLETMIIDGQQVVFAPYHHDQHDIRQYLQKVTSKNSTVILAHVSIDGATVYGASDKSKRECHDSGLTVSFLSQFQRCFTGHFHGHAQYGEGKVVYIGSPIQSGFGEVGDIQKGFVQFYPDRDNWELVSSPFAEHYVDIEWQTLASTPDESPWLDQFRGKSVRILVPSTDSSPASHQTARLFHKLRQAGCSAHKIKRLGSSNALDKTQFLPKPLVDLNTEQPDLGQLAAEYMKTKMSSTSSEAILEQFDRHTTFMTEMLSQQPDDPDILPIFDAQLESITMSHFLNVTDEQTVKLGQLRPETLFLIQGSNGSGKSTLLEALCWCLYGKTLRGFEAGGIIHDGATECNVSVTFKNKITVGRRRNRKDESLYIVKDGVRSADKAAKHGSIEVEILLGATWDDFRYTAVLDPMTMINFNTPSPTELKHQNRFISGTVAIRLDQIVDKIKLSLTSLKKEIKSAEVERDNAQLQMDSGEYRKKELVRQLQNLEEQYQVQLLAVEVQKQTVVAYTLKFERARKEEEDSRQRIVDVKLELHTIQLQVLLYTQQNQKEELETQCRLALRDQEEAQLQLQKVARPLEQNLSVLKAQQTQYELEYNKLNHGTIPNLERQLQKSVYSETNQEEIQKLLDDKIKLQKSLQTANCQLDEIQQKIKKQQHKRAQAHRASKSVSPSHLTTDRLLQLVQLARGYIKTFVVATSQESFVRFQQLWQNLDDNFDNDETQLISEPEPIDTDQMSDYVSLMEEQQQLQLKVHEHSSTIVAAKKQQEINLNRDKWTAELGSAVSARAGLENKIEEAKNMISDYEMYQEQKQQSIRCTRRYELADLRNREFQEKFAIDFQNVAVGTSLESLMHKKQKLSQELEEITENTAASPDKILQELRQLENALASTEARLGCTETDITNHHNSIRSSDHQIETQQVATLHYTNRLETLVKKEQSASFWKDEMHQGGFQQFCNLKPLAKLNQLIRDNLAFLCETVEGNTINNAANLGCRLASNWAVEAHGGGLPFCRRSSGQRKRTCLAIFLSLYQMFLIKSQFRPGFVFLDEISDHLDEDGRDALMRWLVHFSKEYHVQSFLVTHHDGHGCSTGLDTIEVTGDEAAGTQYHIQ